ncbi:hypothetical protein [Shewanella pneumatophori]|uniref:Uncharacterized protein n=1 Tax=Shewanella pneumatophori TaxID=314092 RepID=A0A9X1ZFX8_9GAMM|nr:hypothetical protein [Shewanella pneumatophori]MCL1138700.1 hypothetical protein [Shewanella pneumatophori]
MTNSNQISKPKALSDSCNSCERMTVIEGEHVCFREGKITGLTPMKASSTKTKLICDGWKLGKLDF